MYACISWKHRTHMSNHLKAAPLRISYFEGRGSQKGINLELSSGTIIHSEQHISPASGPFNSMLSFLRQSTLIKQF